MANETSGRPAEKAEVMREEATSVADCRGRENGGEGEGCLGAMGASGGALAGMRGSVAHGRLVGLRWPQHAQLEKAS